MLTDIRFIQKRRWQPVTSLRQPTLVVPPLLLLLLLLLLLGSGHRAAAAPPACRQTLADSHCHTLTSLTNTSFGRDGNGKSMEADLLPIVAAWNTTNSKEILKPQGSQSGRFGKRKDYNLFDEARKTIRRRNWKTRRSAFGNDWVPPKKPLCYRGKLPQVTFSKNMIMFLPKTVAGVPLLEFSTEDNEKIDAATATLTCTLLIDGAHSKHAPYSCDADDIVCNDYEKTLLGVYKVNGDNRNYQRQMHASEKSSAHYCWCWFSNADGMLEVRNLRSTKQIEPGSQLDCAEYKLVAPREQAQQVVPSPEQLSWSTAHLGMTKFSAKCKSQTAINTLVSGRLDMLAVAMKLIGSTAICPSLGAKIMQLRVYPLQYLNCTSGSQACPRLGVVMVVFPFPWNSLNVRQLSMEEGDVLEAGFYLPLPLHVTQFMNPHEQYRVIQEVIPMGTTQSYQKADKLQTDYQDVTVKHPDLSRCIIQLEFLIHTLPGTKKYAAEHCPPAIAYGNRRALTGNSVEFSVKGVVFGIGIHFAKKVWTSNSPLWIVFDGFTMTARHRSRLYKKRVNLVRHNAFTYVPYNVKVIDQGRTSIPIQILQWERPLFEFTIKLESTSPKIGLIQFGLPGLCGTETVDDERLREHKLGISTKVRLTLPNCRPDRCVEYRIDGEHLRPSLQAVDSTKPVVPNWLLNVRPHWSWQQAVAVYVGQDSIRFSEERVADFPGDATLHLDKEQLGMTIVGRIKQNGESETNEPVYPKYVVPIPKMKLSLKETLTLHSYVAQLKYRSHIPGNKRIDSQIGTFIYVSYDQLTFQLGIADLGTPLYRSSRANDPPLFEDRLTLDALDFWNGQTVQVLTVVAVPEPTVLRFVTGKPCLLEDRGVPDSILEPPVLQGRSRCNEDTPPCLFCDPSSNSVINRCIKTVMCQKNYQRSWMPRLPARPAWPECTDDSKCAAWEFLQNYRDKGKFRKLLTGKIDFALQGPTQVILTFRDVFGMLRSEEDHQSLQIAFNEQTIEVHVIRNGYRDFKQLVTVPMERGYLNPNKYHGFRVIGLYERKVSSFHLQDLHEIRPDSRGDPLWSHRFRNERLLITRIHFRPIDPTYFVDKHVIVDCVPSYDKCAGENPCYNGGTCANNKCICSPEFKGENCSENHCPTDKPPCFNGGTCVPTKQHPYWACRCTDDYSGKYCEYMFDYCESYPCKNDATCTPVLGGYECTCSREFTGRNCEVAIGVCKRLEPCKNDGRCIALESEISGRFYRCECLEKFTGPDCEVMRPLRPGLFHLDNGRGMSLKSYPMKLAMQALGTEPLRCFIDLKDNTYLEIGMEDLMTASMNRKRFWKSENFNVSDYHYGSSFYLYEFTHLYVYPGTYNVEVTCTNNGYSTHLGVRPVVIAPNANPNMCLPTVDIRNSGKSRDVAPEYNLRDTLRIYAVTESGCPTVDIDQVRWSVHHITDEEPYPTSSNKVDLADVPMNQHGLRIPAFTLSYGLWAVKMRADAYIDSLGTVSAYELGWFRVTPLPLRCRIAGGDVLSLPLESIVVDATDSRDDDNPVGALGHIDVRWRCWRSPSRQGDSYCLGPQRDLPKARHKRLVAPGFRMTVHERYAFEVTIEKKGHGKIPTRNCTARQTIDVMPKGSKRAAIVCQYNCDGDVDWQEKISFRAECLNCEGRPFSVYWHITDAIGNGTDNIINWREDTAFGQNNQHLIINEEVLHPDRSYHIALKVAAIGENVEAGHAQMTTLHLNGVPKSGHCWVKPTEGVSGITFFSLGCANWTDKHLPLLYQFQEKRHDGKYYVIYEDINPTVDKIMLTIGDAKQGYSNKLRVRISDAGGVYTNTFVSVTVRPPVPVVQADIFTYTEKVFKILPSGLHKIAEAIKDGDFPTALQVVSTSSSLLNEITDPSADPSEITEVEEKRKLRKKLFDSIEDIPTPTLGALQQTSDSLAAVAGGHRDEYFPETAEKLLNLTDRLAKTLLDNYANDPSVSPKLIEKAAQSVVNTLSSAIRVATEDVKPPSLEPVDLFYPNNERDYDVFDDKRIDHLEEKRRRVARVAGKYKSAANSVYETLGKHLEPGQKPKVLKGEEMSLWVQHFDRRTVKNFTMVGLSQRKHAKETDSNYAVMPNVGDILDEHPEVATVELTITAMKRNPYWWDEESAKNVSTDLISVNVRGVPGYRDIEVGNVEKKIDIFLRRSSTDVVRVHGKADLLDWYHTLNGRNNFPKDSDVVNHKIFIPPGGFSQVTQIIPIPQIVLVQDRRNPNITYHVPVKLFINFLKDEKPSIYSMTKSFDDAERRVQWTVPKNRRKVVERDVDIFTIITSADKMKGIEEWYLGVMMHPETSKRLLNDSVLSPIPGHVDPAGAPRTGELEYRHDHDEYLEYQYLMGEHLLKAKEMHARFIEDTETTMDTESEDDGVMLVRGWLTPRTGADGVEAAETPTTISALYRDDALNTLQRAVICTPNMTFHDCERHKHVRYNLTMFAGRCMYWSENLTAFTDQGCEVGPLSTVDVLHCRCSHLTDFAGSFLVLPNRLDVTMVVDMNMMLSQNPTALYWMGVLLLIFLLLLVYARKQDQRDVKRRNIIYVDDNDPRHRYAYLVTVYTGVQYKAGTSAHVAMFLTGEKGSSNTHLLTGEKKRKRTLERGSDSWFLITTHGSLGDLTELHIWHDNSGSNPEWFLERVLVRDCQTDSVWVFLVGRWVHPVTGLLVTVRPAALHEVTAWNTSFARRAEESLRDGHLWFSVFSRPLSSSFTRCQRLACAMTLLMVNLLVSLMFYGVPTGDASDQISRSQSFGLDWYDIVISAESALLVGLLVTPIIVLFRRSEPPTDEQVRTLVTDNDQGDSQTGAKETGRSAVASPAIAGGAPTENNGAEASADIAEMQERVGGGALPLPDKRRGCMLPWWCIYVAWMLAALTMLFSGVLCLAYSAQFGALKCYIWLVSSGVSVLQSVIFIQPLIIVGASLLASWCCQAAPEVENRSEERPAHAAMNADIAEEYAQAIHAKRTQPMYRQVPKRKLRKMRAKKMKDLLTHEAIRDIATFLAYIACLLVIIHGNKDPNAFYSTMTARNLFVEGGAVAGDDDAVTLEDAKELGNVIHYLNTTLIRSLHKAEEYNGKVAVRNGMTRQDGLYLIGVARLRQVRVTRDACRPPDQLFWMNFTACKRPFLLKYEDTKNYGQGWSPEPHLHDDPWDNEATEAWIHKDADYLQTMSVQGKHALYPGSGYTLHLGRAKKASQVVLDYIEDTKWLDAYTKALFVEFTMYNADSDLFNLVVLLFEQSRAGTITPSFDIKTSKLYVDTHMNRLTIFMTIFYVFFIIFNTVVESRKIFRIGPKLYFRDMWSRLDFLLVVMGYVCVVLYINRHIVLEKAFSKLRNTDENKFANFYIPVYWDYILTYAQAFALVLTMAKFWKILTFNKRMVTFSLTLRYSRKELRAFFIFFAIAVIGYAFWSNGLFGASLEDYQNMWSSIISLILFSIGTFDYDGYITTDRTFGAIFFVTYVFFVMIYLINVMLSIIMAGYEMAMDDMQHLVTKYDVVDVFIWEVRNFFEDSSSSSEDEGRMAAARTRQRRRVRELLRRLFPWCLDNARKRDLRRPVEQESMEQLQRFMSLTAAAGGKPPAPADQREGSVASAEDAELRAAAARGRRRVGMIEPEDVDEDEGAAPAAADQQPGHRFLLDEEDVAGGRRGHTRRRVSAAAERHRRRSRATTGRRHRGPPVPRRKSVQDDPHFLPSLTAEPEERPPAAAVAQNSSSAQRRQSTKRRVSGQRRASDRRRSSSRRRSSGPHRPPAPTSSARRRVSSGQRPSGGLQPAPAPRDPSQPSTSGLTRADLARLAGRSTAAPPQAQGSARPHVPTR